MTTDNPLKNYFRQPAIYLRLPSNGKYYPPGSIDMPVNSELPVLPMTAIDEISYRTPDALFNGDAVIGVIQSCIPNIKDAWAIPSVDIDSVLIAIRIASYGHEMEFTSTCPECSHEDDRVMDLRGLLDQIKPAQYDQLITQGDLEMYFQPMSYKNLNDNNLMQFEEQRMFQTLANSEISETDKATALREGLRKITQMTVAALAQNISAIKTPSAFVNDAVNIQDFLENCDRNLFGKIRDHVIKIRSDSEMPPVDLECTECHHKFQQTLTLDMTSFFGVAS